MKVKKFTAATMKEALAQIRLDLGDDALIISTRELSGPLARKFVEVTAAADDGHTQEIVEPERVQYVDTPDLEEQILKNRVLLSESLKPLKEELFQIRTMVDELRRSKAEVRVVPQEDTQPLKEEVRELRAMLSALTRVADFDHNIPFSKALKKAYQHLISSEVEEMISYNLISMADQQLAPHEKEDENAVSACVARLITEAIVPSKPIILTANNPTVMAFIGPTGVGKTTTIAKLAARCVLQMKKKVTLITIDTYRIAAVEQLKTYARIMDIPIYVCYSSREMRRTIQENSDSALILIDTAGHSQTDLEQVNDLTSYFKGQDDIELLLVLSATTKNSDLEDITARFTAVGPDKLVFTKLDETTTYGPLLNEAIRTKLPVGYFSTGQNVPDDIETASPAKLADLIINGEK